MFCIYCGKEIPEGTECDCRRQSPSNAPDASPSVPEAPAPTYTPTPDNAAYSGYGYYAAPRNTAFSNPYQESGPQISSAHQAIKDVFRSPLMLITCILFSADFVLGLIDGFNILPILSTVGLWLVYAFSLKKDAPLKTVGFTFHSIVLIIQRVCLIMLYVIIAILLVFLAFVPNELNEFLNDIRLYMSINYNRDFDYTFSFTSVVFTILLIVWTCFFLFMLFYNIKMRNNVRFLSETAKSAETRRSYSVFPGVVLIIQFLCQAGSLGTYIMTAESRNSFLNSFFNSLLNYVEEEADITLNYTFNFATGYMTIVRMAVSAATLLLAAIMVFMLRSRLNRTKES
ncbi:MAG: hypothetical protein NC223_06025 [Butyrivibrio sp.]|nr:hypothetical protein [Butyrivibrio sp.]